MSHRGRKSGAVKSVACEATVKKPRVVVKSSSTLSRRAGLTISPPPEEHQVQSSAIVISHCRDYSKTFHQVLGPHDPLTYGVPTRVLCENAQYVEAFTSHVRLALELHNPPLVIVVIDKEKVGSERALKRFFAVFQNIVSVACQTSKAIEGMPMVKFVAIDRNREWVYQNEIYTLPKVPMAFTRIRCIDPRLGDFYYKSETEGIEFLASLSFPGSLQILGDKSASHKERRWIYANIMALLDLGVKLIEVDAHTDCKRYPTQGQSHEGEMDVRIERMEKVMLALKKKRWKVGWRIRCVPTTEKLVPAVHHWFADGGIFQRLTEVATNQVSLPL